MQTTMQPDNPARHLYKRNGFVHRDMDEHGYQALWDTGARRMASKHVHASNAFLNLQGDVAIFIHDVTTEFRMHPTMASLSKQMSLLYPSPAASIRYRPSPPASLLSAPHAGCPGSPSRVPAGLHEGYEPKWKTARLSRPTRARASIPGRPDPPLRPPPKATTESTKRDGAPLATLTVIYRPTPAGPGRPATGRNDHLSLTPRPKDAAKGHYVNDKHSAMKSRSGSRHGNGRQLRMAHS
jgi:hypothetical protein